MDTPEIPNQFSESMFRIRDIKSRMNDKLNKTYFYTLEVMVYLIIPNIIVLLCIHVYINDECGFSISSKIISRPLDP